MILVAATAVAIAWTRITVADILGRSSAGVPPGVRMPWLSYLLWWPPAAVPPLMAGTIAAVLFRLRPPRPDWPQLVRQPGAVACGIAAVTLVIQWIMILIGFGIAQIPGHDLSTSSERVPVVMGTRSRPGQHRPRRDRRLADSGIRPALGLGPSWINRAGRLLGALLDRTIPYPLAWPLHNAQPHLSP